MHYSQPTRVTELLVGCPVVVCNLRLINRIIYSMLMYTCSLTKPCRFTPQSLCSIIMEECNVARHLIKIKNCLALYNNKLKDYINIIVNRKHSEETYSAANCRHIWSQQVIYDFMTMQYIFPLAATSFLDTYFEEATSIECFIIIGTN